MRRKRACAITRRKFFRKHLTRTRSALVAPEFEEREALREAGRRLDAWMAEKKVSEDELVADFEHSRKTGRRRGR